MRIDPALSAAAGAALIAVLNEVRARSRARTAHLEREELADELRAQAEHTRSTVTTAMEDRHDPAAEVRREARRAVDRPPPEVG